MRELRIFMWAAMHHPDFWQCYIRSPFVFKVARDHWKTGWYFNVTIGVRNLTIYNPYHVYDAYLVGIGKAVKLECEYDDIPF